MLNPKPKPNPTLTRVRWYLGMEQAMKDEKNRCQDLETRLQDQDSRYQELESRCQELEAENRSVLDSVPILRELKKEKDMRLKSDSALASLETRLQDQDQDSRLKSESALASLEIENAELESKLTRSLKMLSKLGTQRGSPPPDGSVDYKFPPPPSPVWPSYSDALTPATHRESSPTWDPPTLEPTPTRDASPTMELWPTRASTLVAGVSPPSHSSDRVGDRVGDLVGDEMDFRSHSSDLITILHASEARARKL